MKKNKTLKPVYTEADLPNLIQEIEAVFGQKPVVSEKGKHTKEYIEAQKMPIA
jgi:hypothetical protein